MGEAKRRAARILRGEASQAEILLRAHGVDVDRPGFYDQPSFQKQEQLDSSYLENYAKFVRERSMTTEYIERTKKLVPAIASRLYEQLLKIERRRACMDAGLALSKMLEDVGIWNSVVRGAFSAELANQPGTRRYLHAFGPLDDGCSVHGHVWIMAPPFTVVDVTAKLQGWGSGSQLDTLVPEIVLSERIGGVQPHPELLFDHDELVRAQRMGHDVHKPDFVPSSVRKFMSEFRGTEIKANGVVLRYQPTAITAPDVPFQQVGTGEGGLQPYTMWTETLKPSIVDLL